MKIENKTSQTTEPAIAVEPVLALRTSCMPCRHCKVLQGKLNTPMSFLCFKDKFILTTNQDELFKHICCSLFEHEY